ncbi:hypothetical protein R80B4_02755 [Fibrobacteres bacterium R8-0-B4]
MRKSPTNPTSVKPTGSRKTYDDAFKAKVALAVLRETMPLSVYGGGYTVHSGIMYIKTEKREP